MEPMLVAKPVSTLLFLNFRLSIHNLFPKPIYLCVLHILSLLFIFGLVVYSLFNIISSYKVYLKMIAWILWSHQWMFYSSCPMCKAFKSFETKYVHCKKGCHFCNTLKNALLLNWRCKNPWILTSHFQSNHLSTCSTWHFSKIIPKIGSQSCLIKYFISVQTW
jgi:hypothetical protein